jgi:2-keto-3-deoxy-L-rhamnonate aldolase RhmA
MRPRRRKRAAVEISHSKIGENTTMKKALLTALLLSLPMAAQQGKLYNTAKQKLLDGKQINAHTIGRFDTAEYCAQAPHYDFTWFEMQHSTLSYGDVERMIAACPKAGAIPMIRVPDATESDIQKAMDLGALGIIVPTVDTPEKAQAAAKWALYPPAGRRSQGGGYSSRLWEGTNYRQTVNANVLIILMIETPIGVANAYDIAAVPGIDVVITGNSDFTNFSGWPADHPRYQQMMVDTRDGVKKAGKFFGAASVEYRSGHALSPDVKVTQGGPSNDGWVNPNAPVGKKKKQ